MQIGGLGGFSRGSTNQQDRDVRWLLGPEPAVEFAVER